MADEKNISLKQLRELAIRADKRLDKLEENRAKGQAMTLGADGWARNSGDDNFPYQYILTAEGTTSASRADAVLDTASIMVAARCGMCATTETGENAVIFKSYEKPTSALTGVVYIRKTAAMGGE